MITTLEGILEHRDVDSVTVKTGPLSLLVFVSNSTLNQLGQPGERIYLYTHLYLREDYIALFGFASEGEVRLFQKLISVSGVGPRLALALLSSFNPEQLVSAIINNNTDLISQSPGIGKKIAGRIVLELKSKLEKEGIGEFIPAMSAESADIISALTSLGYSIREASQAVSRLPDSKDMKLEDRIKLALQQLSHK